MTSHTPGNTSDYHSKMEPVVGMFRSPLQPGSTFNPAHQVSEPELVGVPRATALSSLASMI